MDKKVNQTVKYIFVDKGGVQGEETDTLRIIHR